MTIPTDGIPHEEIDQFVGWLRAEVTARRSRLTEAQADQLAQEIDADWWEKNKAGFGASDGQ